MMNDTRGAQKSFRFFLQFGTLWAPRVWKKLVKNAINIEAKASLKLQLILFEIEQHYPYNN